ncbi:MAG: homoserine dehydrogenase [Aquificae bacterium]|nr:homoserine dehydrogenase [Aquificota bacterium]
MQQINIAIVGYGTVGNAVAQILEKEKELLAQKSGFLINLQKVYTRNWDKDFQFPLKDTQKASSLDEILNNPSIDIVVELTGGIEFPLYLFRECIKKQKHIVTANKALLAEKGKEIFQLAEEKNVRIGFEASVAGGIPVIRALREGLVANKIKNIYGILNGTTNFILTKMYAENKNFHEILKEAQEKGYAEADPTLDINGTDAAHKIAILASLAYGGFLDFSNIYVEGIENIEKLDIELGKELGYILKLLAISKAHNEQVEIRVHPTFLPQTNPLSSVNGVFNAILIEGNYVGETMFYGKGAGGEPTASAVVSDIVDIGKSLVLGVGREIEVTSMNWRHKDLNLKKVEDFYTRYYIRFTVPDIIGVLSKIAAIFARYKISIAAVIQKEKVVELYTKNTEKTVPLVILTHTASENNIQKAIKDIESQKITKSRTVIIRVEDPEE